MQLRAQQNAILSGTITDSQQRVLYGAYIQIENLSQYTTSDTLGNFSISIPANKSFRLKITHLSFSNFETNITLKAGEKRFLAVAMNEKQEQLQEVTIESSQNIKNTNTIIDAKLAKQLPVSGSGAIEQIIKTLPGVSSNNELSSQYSVRGGNFDENLVYINDIEIYRPNLIRSGQQEGLSIINPDLVSSVQFSAGGFEAKYGDKLSSVLDVKYKTPNEFEASAEASLLGYSLHFANQSANKKLSYMAGFRYKTNAYLLNSLDTEGEYKARYTDFQSIINYQFSPSISMHLWTSFSQNKYNFTPETRNTTFGTINEALQLKIYFEGEEEDQYDSNIQALTLKYHPTSESFYQLIASRYKTTEEESFDILGQYYLSDLFVSQGGNSSESITYLGVGSFLDHARNKLEKEVNSIQLKGDHKLDDLFVQWGIQGKQEEITDQINEWQYQDSAGYSLPVSSENVALAYSRNANNKVKSRHLSSFVEASYALKNSKGEFEFTGGLRHHFWDYTKENFFSPRLSINYIPKWEKKVKFRFSTGYYQQTPSYREMLTIDGQISTNLKKQKSIHYLLGQEYFFTAWGRPFKFSSELYYKDIKSAIPYDIDNIRILYYGDQRSKAYSAGLDLRINGEFVPGTESWASLSILKTEEDIYGDMLSYLPRPTDERLNFSMFFQDYLPSNPSYKMHLSLFYGGRLPVWAPKTGKTSTHFRMPNYKRIDLGFSKILIEEDTINKTGFLKNFKSMWIGLEIFNVLDINNTVSYLWISDISGNQYAIPNYLTSRKLNLKLTANF
jgi:hypothetical protein